MGARNYISNKQGIETAPEAYAYKAFISYSHKDEKHVRSLHRKLESFRIPSSVNSRAKTLKPIFRDRDDLSAGAELDQQLRDILKASENLIVICSPNSAHSKWVNEEVRYFKQLGRADRIFTVIIDGEPFASDGGMSAALECFPEAIKYNLDQHGEIGRERSDPVSADFRRQGDGPKIGLLKLISGLLSIGLDELVRRDLAKSRLRLGLVTAMSTIIISIMASLTWFAMDAQKEAYARKADAEDFVEFMLSDFRGELEKFGRLDLMESVGVKAIDYYEQFDDADFALDDDSNGRRARALQFLGELKHSLGDIEDADGYFKRSYAITQKAVAREPFNAERVREHAISSFLRSKTFRRQEDHIQEKTFLEEYGQMAEQFIALDTDQSIGITHLGLAKTNLGRVKLRLNDVRAAKADFEAADALFEQINSRSETITHSLNLAENLAWLAQAHRVLEDHHTAFEIRQKQVDVLTALSLQQPNDFRLLEGLVYAKIGLGSAASHLKDYDEAVKCHKYVLEKAEFALQVEPNREKMLRAKVSALIGLMNTSLQTRSYKDVKSYRNQISLMLDNPPSEAVKETLFWKKHLPKLLSEFDQSYVLMADTNP